MPQNSCFFKHDWTYTTGKLKSRFEVWVLTPYCPPKWSASKTVMLYTTDLISIKIWSVTINKYVTSSYVIAELTKCVKISIQTFRGYILQKIIQKQKRIDTSFQITFFEEFFAEKFHFGQISLTDCVYLPSYSVKYSSCFLLRHLMA